MAQGQSFQISSAGGSFTGVAQTVQMSPYAYDLGQDLTQNYVLTSPDSYSASNVNHTYAVAEAHANVNLDTGLSDILFAVSNEAARSTSAQAYGTAMSSLTFQVIFSVMVMTEVSLQFDPTGLPDGSYEIDNYTVTLSRMAGTTATALYSRSASEDSFDPDGDGVFFMTTLAPGTEYRLELGGSFLNDGAGQASGALSFNPVPVPEVSGAGLLLLGSSLPLRRRRGSAVAMAHASQGGKITSS